VARVATTRRLGRIALAKSGTLYYLFLVPMPPITVVETPTFKNIAHRLMSDEEREEAIDFLARNPEAGDEITGTGGVRKVRWAREHEGKSGGYRIIYYFYNENFPLFALTIYPKNEKENLTQGEKNEMKKLTRELVKLYREGVKRNVKDRK
jgi:hypothetical protein